MNLDDIAKKAGVSRATVSRVINNKGYVSAATRARVAEVIERESFSPNPAAKMLVTQRTRTIGVVMNHLPYAPFDDSRYFGTLLQGISQVAYERDYSVLLWLEQPGDTVEHFYKRILKNRLMDGLLLTASMCDDPLLPRILESRIPFTMVDQPLGLEDQITYVTIDNASAVYQVVNHFVTHNRRRIAIITGNLQHIDGQTRLAAYRHALESFGIAYHPDWVAYGDFSFQSGYTAMKGLIVQNIDAVFACSDMAAAGAIKALNEAGLRVPGEIAVIGFDDLPIALNVLPHLTTIHQPLIQKGARAADLLIDLVEGKQSDPIHEILPTHLVIRESCGSTQRSANGVTTDVSRLTLQNGV
jgi:LacI family transcriptional regulator